MTVYRGIYSLKDDAGKITDVQVVSQPDGNSLPLPIETYRARNVQPEPETLPDQNQWPEVANRCRLIHEIAVKVVYAAEAANLSRAAGHPHSEVDRQNIAEGVEKIQQLGGKVYPVANVPGSAAFGTRLLVIDASGLAVPNNVRVV